MHVFWSYPLVIYIYISIHNHIGYIDRLFHFLPPSFFIIESGEMEGGYPKPNDSEPNGRPTRPHRPHLLLSAEPAFSEDRSILIP